MTPVEKTKDKFRFKCRGCKRTIEGYGAEFEYVKLGVLGYQCPVCKKFRTKRELSIERVEGFKPSAE